MIVIVFSFLSYSKMDNKKTWVFTLDLCRQQKAFDCP